MKTLVINIYNSPSAVTFGKGDQVAVANVAAYNAPFNITAALGNNTVTLSFLRIQHSDDKYAYSGVVLHHSANQRVSHSAYGCQ